MKWAFHPFKKKSLIYRGKDRASKKPREGKTTAMKYNTVNTYYPGTEKAGGGISGVPE